jgi:adenosylcobinamide-phosphate synthase
LEGLSLPDLPFAVQTWLALVIAWLVERRFPVAPAVDPIAFFRFICQRMASKVLPAEQQTQQHFISGTLALMLLIGPTIIIIYLVHAFASYPWLFDIIILYVALQYSATKRSIDKIESALLEQKKQLAKDQLQPLVLRNTHALSSIGIAKASIESATLRISYQQISVMFWFICIGPIFALTYRLCYEVSQSWNIKLKQFHRFGWLAAKLCALLQWPPTRLYAVILALLSLSMPFKIFTKRLLSLQGLSQTNGSYLLSAMGLVLNKHMSGPVMYDLRKYRREKYLGEHEPQISDINAAQSANTKAAITMIVLMLVISLILNSA